MVTTDLLTTGMIYNMKRSGITKSECEHIIANGFKTVLSEDRDLKEFSEDKVAEAAERAALRFRKIIDEIYEDE